MTKQFLFIDVNVKGLCGNGETFRLVCSFRKKEKPVRKGRNIIEQQLRGFSFPEGTILFLQVLLFSLKRKKAKDSGDGTPGLSGTGFNSLRCLCFSNCCSVDLTVLASHNKWEQVMAQITNLLDHTTGWLFLAFTFFRQGSLLFSKLNSEGFELRPMTGMFIIFYIYK